MKRPELVWLRHQGWCVFGDHFYIVNARSAHEALTTYTAYTNPMRLH